MTAGTNFVLVLRVASEDNAAQLQDVLHESAGTGSQARMAAGRSRLCRQETRGVQCSVTRLGSAWQRVCSPRRLNSRMHKDARKSWNFPEGESMETVKILYSARLSVKPSAGISYYAN